ncbi:MAG: glycosyltransferase family 1 protein [Patescibacteria group bacterium]|jgi:glycosyltransferase involved in cell wall biosynthesis
MRIGIDASRANCKEKTGTEWYAFYLIKALFKHIQPQDQVILYLKDQPIVDWGEMPVNFNFKILNWPPKFLWTQIRLSLEMLLKPVDILFVPAHTIPIICPKNTLTTIHDIGFEHNQSLYDQKDISRKGLGKNFLNFIVRLVTLGKYGANEYDYHRFSARLAFKKCKNILTVSEFSKKDIINTYKIEPERITVIYNGVNTDKFNISVKNDLTKIHEIQGRIGIKPPYLMTLGRIEKKKNSLGLVEAFCLLKKEKGFNDFKLLMVGKPGFGYSEILNKIKSYGLEKEIYLPGWVADQDIPYLLASAEVFLLPSFFEGFGVPVIEAMAVNTPVVCSNLTAFPEIIGSAGILIDPYNPGKIAQAIKKIFEDPELINRLTQEGQQRSKIFNWDKSAKLLSRIIYSL